MSEFNEDMLNDIDDIDLGEADEDALLKDDDEGEGDVLDIVPEEELGESLDDSKIQHSEVEEEIEQTRHEKFAVERQQIIAPEHVSDELQQNNSFQKTNNRGNVRGNQRGRGGLMRGGNGRGKFQYNGRGRYAMGSQMGRNKTVLINPRFQGVVHVNNNARLAWDTAQQQHYQPNPWSSGTPPGQMAMGRHMHPVQGPGPQMPPIQHIQPPMQQPPQMQGGFYQGPPMQQDQQPMHMGPPGQQMPFVPPHQQNYMPQPLPPGVVQQPPMQGPPNPPVNPYVQNNFQPAPPMMMNPNQPPPPQCSTPNFQMYNQHGNMSPMPPHQNFNTPTLSYTPPSNPNFNFTPPQPQRQMFMKNNNQNNMNYNQGNNMLRNNKTELFTQKRKVMTGGYPQNKKVFVKDRLGTPQQQPKSERPSVVKEVTVTNITTVKIEEDEATKDLRIKIEEQKRQRQQILQWKEQRRLEQLGQATNTVTPNQKPVPQVHQGNQQSPIAQVRNSGFQQNIQGQQQTSPNRPIKLKPQSNNIVITNGYSRKITKFQKQKPEQVTPVNRSVVLTVPTTPIPVQEEPELKLDKKTLSNFLQDRKILTKDESLMATRKVVIKNISTSTGDKKLIQISKNIGEVQKLHRDKNERQATITFKSVASAHAFFKKYQRHMLDLSMIEVSLCPMSESDE